MMPPPPMPNRPAKRPVASPPATIRSRSQASSLAGTPKYIRCSAGGPDETFPGFSSRDRRRLRDRPVNTVTDERQRLDQDIRPGAGLDRVGRQVTAEGARARHTAEEAE